MSADFRKDIQTTVLSSFCLVLFLIGQVPGRYLIHTCRFVVFMCIFGKNTSLQGGFEPRTSRLVASFSIHYAIFLLLHCHYCPYLCESRSPIHQKGLSMVVAFPSTNSCILSVLQPILASVPRRIVFRLLRQTQGRTSRVLSPVAEPSHMLCR